jgi:fructose-1,6-bisphosphatase I
MNPELKSIVETIKHSCNKISHYIRKKSLLRLGEVTDNRNSTNDAVKQLDLKTNKLFINDLSKNNSIKLLASEEEEELINCNKNGKYLVSFDPLDGSSNIDVNIDIGTIFGIFEINENTKKNNIICAGYCLYGPQTQFVLAHEKVELYQLYNKEFILINEDLKIPNKGNIVSMNFSYNHINLDKRYENLALQLFDKGYTHRFVGSLVADAHRTLLKGGIFMYPKNKNSKTGKIRLLYEAIPFAFIFEKAGGVGSNGVKRLIDVDFKDIHQRTEIILSSEYEFSKL